MPLKRKPLGAIHESREVLDIPDGEIVRSWLRYHAQHQDADFWAFDIFHDIVPNDPTRAWALILALVAAAPDDTLGMIGAGPLEDFVRLHGNEWIEKIHTEARTNPRFKESLSRVWISQGALTREAEARLVAASDGQIKPLKDSYNGA